MPPGAPPTCMTDEFRTTGETDRSKAVLVGMDGLDDLSVDEVRRDGVEFDVVPRREHLLAIVQLPRRVLLSTSLAADHHLALGDGVHHVVRSLTQRRHLHVNVHAAPKSSDLKLRDMSLSPAPSFN